MCVCVCVCVFVCVCVCVRACVCVCVNPPVTAARGRMLTDKVPAIIAGDRGVGAVDVGTPLEFCAHVLARALGR